MGAERIVVGEREFSVVDAPRHWDWISKQCERIAIT
jgi:hypothetical protein